MKICTIPSLVGMCLFVQVVAGAQDLSNPTLLNLGDDVPGEGVRTMAQDSLGFLWIGSTTGLARFDGSRVKIFGRDTNETAIHGTHIYQIMFANGYMWCSHNNGLSRMDLHTNEFKNYSFELKNMHYRRSNDDIQDAIGTIQMRDGTIWLGLRNDGIARYDAKRDTFIRVRPPEKINISRTEGNWSVDNIRALLEDRFEDHVLWIGTLDGLLRLDTKTETFRHYRWEFEDKAWETNLNVFRRIVQLPDGRIVWGTWHAGTHVLEPETGEYYRLPNSDNDQGITRTTISRLHLLGDTTLWVSTGIGVCAYDIRSNRITKVYHDDYAQGEVYRMDFVDNKGRVYGFSVEGVNIYDPMLQQFKAYSFAALDPSRRGMVFDVRFDEGTGKYLVCVRSEGIYTLDPLLNKWERIDLPERVDIRTSSNIFPSYDGDGIYILQIGEDFLIYDIKRNSILDEHLSVDIPTGGIVDIMEDAHRNVWIATNRDGFYRWNRNTGEFSEFNTPGTQTAASGERGVFYEDSRGNIWIKKRVSFHVYNYDENRLYDFMDGWSFPYIQTFGEVNGQMYFSANGGIYRMAVDSFRYAAAHRVEGINGIHSVAASPDGLIWSASNTSLFSYNPETGEKQSYDFQYGSAPTALFDYSISADGIIALGDYEKIVLVDPDHLRPNTYLPKPYISAMHIGDRIVEPSLYDIEAGHIECIKLAYDEDFFSIDISAISFLMPKDNKFQYRLRDLKEEWTAISGVQTINFTNVPSGEYTFELMAANNEGVWNEDVYQLPIVVATPWYNTPLTRASAVIILLLMIFLAYQYRVKQIRKEERLRTQYERELADVEMSALRAQMNPHFIFNCLNSIENFIIKNDTYRASTYLHDFARLIRLILQNSRSKYIPLVDELEALELYLEMESLRFTNKFEYEIMVEPDVDTSQLEVPPMIIQPYVENAIWHGLIPKQRPGKLIVHISRQNGVLNCAIEDNGIGRAKSAEINQKRKHDKPKSMGMSITSERINILNNLYNTNTTIEIIDMVDPEGEAAGTRVELNVPVE